MKKYEMMVIYDTEVNPLEETKNFVKDTFNSLKITVVDEKDMGFRDLAYTINKKKKGFYALFHFESPENAVKEINKAFGLYKGIMRNLILVQE